MVLSYLIKGTFWLTAAGLITRTAGFFYKIFLSRIIGAEEIGLFQLCMPLYTFCLAAASGGIQTALSRFIAEAEAKKDPEETRCFLRIALFLTFFISLLLAFCLWGFSDVIAVRFLLETRCQWLLQLLALSLPFCAGHACLIGYFLGKKQAGITALSQLIEQGVRILTAVLCCLFLSGRTAQGASVLALGTLAGEGAACLYCLLHLPRLSFGRLRGKPLYIRPVAKHIFAIAAPLSLCRMMLCILQAIEAALLPQQLQRYGLSASDALSCYGILSGMVLPLLLFPTAVTGSFGMLLLPLISEAQTLRHESRIVSVSRISFFGSLLLGLFFSSFFFLSGDVVGRLLFDSEEAGRCIRSLALLCPLLYSSTTLTGILHGLGKTAALSVQSTAGFLLRLLFVLFAVPRFGLAGYVPGLLVSQLFLVIATLCLLGEGLQQPLFSLPELLLPALPGLIAVGIMLLLDSLIPWLGACSWGSLLVHTALLFLIFSASVICGYFPASKKN